MPAAVVRPARPALTFLAGRAPFAARVLQGLLEAGVGVQRVVLCGALPGARGRELPVLVPERPDPGAVAAAAGLPLRAVRGLPAAADLGTDLVLAACFPRRLPEALLGRPAHGCLNLHPSLLPAYRGPAPLFWQLRDGIGRSGVTLHRMSARLDAGAVISRHARALPAGTTLDALEAALAAAGARLAAAAVRRLEAGEALPGAAQDESAASSQPAPGPGDFRVPASWPAERAFRFIRGVAGWGVPFEIELPGRRLAVREARGYSAAARLPVPWELRGGVLHIRFSPGVLEALPAAPAERR